MFSTASSRSLRSARRWRAGNLAVSHLHREIRLGFVGVLTLATAAARSKAADCAT